MVSCAGNGLVRQPLQAGLKQGLKEGLKQPLKQPLKRARNVDPKDPFFRHLVQSHIFFPGNFGRGLTFLDCLIVFWGLIVGYWGVTSKCF